MESSNLFTGAGHYLSRRAMWINPLHLHNATRLRLAGLSSRTKTGKCMRKVSSMGDYPFVMWLDTKVISLKISTPRRSRWNASVISSAWDKFEIAENLRSVKPLLTVESRDNVWSQPCTAFRACFKYFETSGDFRYSSDHSSELDVIFELANSSSSCATFSLEIAREMRRSSNWLCRHGRV